jgi:dTDP-4-dehydrorhamnose 3,5-epimerase-like enzyme
VTKELAKGCRLIALASCGDERGSLVAIEGERTVPFAIERVYYVYATKPGVTRGFHAHRALNQLAIAVAGSCTMMIDDGSARVEVRLDSPEVGLTLGSMVWREMSDFSPDCVLMVLADAPYDESDYIRDYDQFLALATA